MFVSRYLDSVFGKIVKDLEFMSIRSNATMIFSSNNFKPKTMNQMKDICTIHSSSSVSLISNSRLSQFSKVR